MVKVHIWKGDITKLTIQCIVNAANSSLLGGAGVDGAIHRAAGPKLKDECRKLKGCAVGDAKITGAYDMINIKHIIHTVGPQDQNPVKLASCYSTSLNVAKENKVREIAFPCIATGVYGYDNTKAAHVACETLKNWLEFEENYKSVYYFN
ncbi:hypothetical protein HDV02_002012 [Globomyces sp. JEL0801]|nr:hypothetical protein HDV02_002012 [Globomyces sp. JEL0801]